MFESMSDTRKPNAANPFQQKFTGAVFAKKTSIFQRTCGCSPVTAVSAIALAFAVAPRRGMDIVIFPRFAPKIESRGGAYEIGRRIYCRKCAVKKMGVEDEPSNEQNKALERFELKAP